VKLFPLGIFRIKGHLPEAPAFEPEDFFLSRYESDCEKMFPDGNMGRLSGIQNSQIPEGARNGNRYPYSIAIFPLLYRVFSRLNQWIVKGSLQRIFYKFHKNPVRRNTWADPEAEVNWWSPPTT